MTVIMLTIFSRKNVLFFSDRELDARRANFFSRFFDSDDILRNVNSLIYELRDKKVLITIMDSSLATPQDKNAYNTLAESIILLENDGQKVSVLKGNKELIKFFD